MKTTKTKKKKEVTLSDLALMMGIGFNEVDKKFAEVHEKMDKGFAEVDERFDKVDGKFANVYKEIDNARVELSGEIKELKESFNTLQIAVDGYAKRADDYFQEMVMLSHKVDRIEKWVLQLAEKVGVQLKA